MGDVLETTDELVAIFLLLNKLFCFLMLKIIPEILNNLI
jgi:hypothetical protein